MSRVQRATGKRRTVKTGRRKRRRLVLLAGWLVLLLFVLAAFYMPQAVFRMQDNLLYARTSLGEREHIDVEALGTSYERSLRARMLHFAEGLAAGESFYVTSQELAVTQELYDALYRDSGVYSQRILQVLDNWNLISPEFAWMECPVNRWKQYVIYTDDYARGVSFILWYIELRDDNGELLKFLMDAETHTIYALKEEDAYKMQPFTLGGSMQSEQALFCSFEAGAELWFNSSLYYEAVRDEDMDAVIAEVNEWTGAEWESFYQELDALELYDMSSMSDVYLIFWLYYGDAFLREYMLDRTDEFWLEKPEGLSGEKNVFCFPLIYEEARFEFVLDLREAERVELEKNHSAFSYVSPNVTVGIRQIYELIPEFAGTGK